MNEQRQLKEKPTVEDILQAHRNFFGATVFAYLPSTEFGYVATEDGCIYSVVDGWGPRITPVHRRQSTSSRGYRTVTIAIRGRKENRLVHRLIAEGFLGLDPGNHKLQVNHLDGDKANNAVSNLRLCSDRENKLHAVRLGLHRRSARNWAKEFQEHLDRKIGEVP